LAVSLPTGALIFYICLWPKKPIAIWTFFTASFFHRRSYPQDTKNATSGFKKKKEPKKKN